MTTLAQAVQVPWTFIEDALMLATCTPFPLVNAFPAIGELCSDVAEAWSLKTEYARADGRLQMLSANMGFGDVPPHIQRFPEEKRADIEADIAVNCASSPRLAMVESSRGIANSYVPCGVTVDAKTPAVIRSMDGLGDGLGDGAWCPDSKPGA